MQADELRAAQLRQDLSLVNLVADIGREARQQSALQGANDRITGRGQDDNRGSHEPGGVAGDREFLEADAEILDLFWRKPNLIGLSDRSDREDQETGNGSCMHHGSSPTAWL